MNKPQNDASNVNNAVPTREQKIPQQQNSHDHRETKRRQSMQQQRQSNEGLLFFPSLILNINPKPGSSIETSKTSEAAAFQPSSFVGRETRVVAAAMGEAEAAILFCPAGLFTDFLVASVLRPTAINPHHIYRYHPPHRYNSNNSNCSNQLPTAEIDCEGQQPLLIANEKKETRPQHNSQQQLNETMHRQAAGVRDHSNNDVSESVKLKADSGVCIHGVVETDNCKLEKEYPVTINPSQPNSKNSETKDFNLGSLKQASSPHCLASSMAVQMCCLRWFTRRPLIERQVCSDAEQSLLIDNHFVVLFLSTFLCFSFFCLIYILINVTRLFLLPFFFSLRPVITH